MTATTTTDTADRLLPLAVVAERLGASRETLWSWRRDEVGPPSYKIRGLVVYSERELNAWIDEQKAATRKGGN